ncbi:MAG TPA: MFS transporter [Thermoanaerobaculia bacterium]|nr:MFS transporter [Thermoanaerobaculia bacterium]
MPADKLWNRDFFLLWQGQTISQLGNQAFSIAMMYWLMRATGSASLMGLLMFAATLPGVLLGPFGGTFADRHSRIRIAVVCDLLSGLCILTLGFLLLDPRVQRLEPEAVRFVLGLIFGGAVLVGALRAFRQPALGAAIPDLVPRDRIPAANSLNQFAVQASTLVGQAAGGVLYQALGAAVLFLLDGSSFLYAAVSALFVRVPERQAESKPVQEHPFRHFLRQTAEGFRYLGRNPGLRDFAILASMLNFFIMPVLVLLPFYVDLYLKEDARWYGFLMAAIGGGSVVGYLLAGILKLSGRVRRVLVLSTLLLFPVLFSVIAFVSNPFIALAISFLNGAALGIINVYTMSLVQASTPQEVRGRVLGVLMTLSAGLTPLAMALGGVVGDLTGKNIPLIYGVCAACSLLLTLGLGFRRDVREFLASG